MASKNIQLPELGEGVAEGELVKWLVKPGDKISADQPIAEMMTDKATVEVPSPSAGVVKELKGKEGDVITVGTVMIVIDTDGAAGASATPTQQAASKDAPAKAGVTSANASAAGQANGKLSGNSAAQSSGQSGGQMANGQAAVQSSPGGGLRNIQLPELGEGVAEGELVKWLVKPGDKISADQAIAEMMTDKATVEVPSPAAGTVKELRGKEGDIITVGTVMIVLETAGGASAQAAGVKPAAASTTTSSHGQGSAHSPSAAPAMMASSTQTSRASTSAGGIDVHPPVADAKVLATPATRRLAREMGVDINVLRGSGVAGRVTREDVLGSGAGAVAAGSPSVKAPSATGQAPAIPRPAYQGPAGAAEERIAIRGIRKKIAENMQTAKHIIPHITIADEANITALVKLREELKAQAEKTGVKITYLPFVMKAMIAAIREFPMFNASIDDAAQEIVYKKYFNIGFAADTPNGLVVPVIKNADQKTIAQISKEILELAKKARDGKLALEDMKGATITITNIGSFGGTYATPIINHPEVAILGMYKIQDKPVVKPKAGGGYDLDVIKAMNFTVTADHRLIDGAAAIRFLQAFIARIENPGALMLDMM